MKENINDQFQLPQISIHEVLKIEKRFEGGANWFFWIAGLSLVNTIIVMGGGTITFIVGLGITQIIDAFIAVFKETMQVSSVSATILNLVGFSLVVGVLSVFVLFGILARKQYQWAFIIGMIIYALDGLIFLAVGDTMSVGFHVFALFGLFGGLQALRKLKAIEQSGYNIAASIEFTESKVVQKPSHDRNYWLRISILALIAFVPLLFFIIWIFTYQ